MSAGLIRTAQNTFSTVFRLIDLAVITSLMLIVCYAMDVVFVNVYMFQIITAIAFFLLYSESLELYRSWRTDSLTTQLSVTLVCWGMVCGSLAFIMYFTPVFDAGQFGDLVIKAFDSTVRAFGPQEAKRAS